MDEKQPLTSADMARKRWAKVGKRERSAIMTAVRAKNQNPGRKKDTERCYCGAHALHTARVRRFDCCKRAGVYPR
jgi:hypothetical protein